MLPSIVMIHMTNTVVICHSVILQVDVLGAVYKDFPIISLELTVNGSSYYYISMFQVNIFQNLNSKN